jgi:hypothetical protein
MPSFGSSLSDQEIWTLALFLRQLEKLPPAVQQAWLQLENWPPGAAKQPDLSRPTDPQGAVPH